MDVATLIQEIDSEVARLPENLQRQVLEFVRQLKHQKLSGIRGDDMLRFAGLFTSEEAEEMMSAISQGCGRVDHC